MSKLTLQQLTDVGACKAQVELFREMFGESVNVTQELCVSVADIFNFSWAAHNLLLPKEFREYERIMARVWAALGRVEARAFAEIYNQEHR